MMMNYSPMMCEVTIQMIVKAVEDFGNEICKGVNSVICDTQHCSCGIATLLHSDPDSLSAQNGSHFWSYSRMTSALWPM